MSAVTLLNQSVHKLFSTDFFTLAVCIRNKAFFELFWEAGKDKCFHKVEMVSQSSELISCLSI